MSFRRRVTGKTEDLALRWRLKNEGIRDEQRGDAADRWLKRNGRRLTTAAPAVEPETLSSTTERVDGSVKRSSRSDD